MDSKQLDRIESKLDALDKRQDKMDVHMAVYNEQLKIHVAGVIEARAEIKKNQDRIAKSESKIYAAEGALKFIGLLATLGGLVLAVVEIVKHVR